MLVLLYWLCCAPVLAASCPKVESARPVPTAAGGEITVATQNLMRLFDDRDDGRGEVLSSAQYRLRLDKLARQIGGVLGRPHVLALQEAENSRVLEDLAARLAADGARYQAVLREGHDRGGIDVGFLVRADWKIRKVEQLLARQRLGRAFLFDRPPLLLRVETPQGVLDIVNVHLKSLRGSDDRSEARRIARKRRQQAAALAAWLRPRLLAEAAGSAPPLLVLGDFNATPEGAGGVDVLGILQATGLQRVDSGLPPGERWTYVFRCRAQALDHILASPGIAAAGRLAVSRGNAGAPARLDDEPGTPRRSSDHDGLVLYLRH
jgi:predicted extracellular nuclease